MEDRKRANIDLYDYCKEYGRQRGLAEALKLTPKVAHVVESEIPSVFGEKWKGEMEATRASLKEEYGENLGDLLRLVILLQEYEAVSAASLFECLLRDSDQADGAELAKLCTPDGYVEHEGFASVFVDAIATIPKPKELLSLTAFDSYPADLHLFMAMALVCFFKAAEYLRKDEQEAFAWLYESSKLLHAGWSFEGWLIAEQETKEHIFRERGSMGAKVKHKKAAPLKEIAYQAADKSPDQSANQIAIEVERLILEQSRLIGYPLSPTNARNTIAKWIREHRKHTSSS